MFYDEFVRLCAIKNVSRTKACVDCGICRTAWHKWENGATPNGSTLNLFADYFGVPVDFLLSAEENVAYARPRFGQRTTRRATDDLDLGEKTINEIKTFYYHGHKVRTVWKEGKLWFVLKDACNAIDYTNVSRAYQRLVVQEKSTAIINHQRMNIISKDGLCNVLLHTAESKAQSFWAWITSDVLPQARGAACRVRVKVVRRPRGAKHSGCYAAARRDR